MGRRNNDTPPPAAAEAAIHNGSDPVTGEDLDHPFEEAEDGQPLGHEISLVTIDVESDTLAGDMRDMLLSLYRNRPKPWEQLKEYEQRDLVEQIDRFAKKLVGRACILLAAGGRRTAQAVLEGFSQKETAVIKASLLVSANPETVLALSTATQRTVQLVFVDAADHQGERSPVAIDEDEPKLAVFDETPNGEAQKREEG